VSDVQVAEAVFVPTGRPVVRFVAAVAAIAIVCAVTWGSALFNARVEVTFQSWQAAPVGTAVVAVHNQGPTTARVRVRDVNERFVHLTAPVREVRIAGDATGHLSVHYRVDCAGYERAVDTPAGATSPSLRLVVVAAGPLGGGHSFVPSEGDNADLSKACKAISK
jgi:hypothetical protein